MAIDPKKLGRLTEVIRRFTDPNEGSAISAFNGFRAMCKGQHIDLRDYEVRKAGAPAWEAQQLQATTQELEMARDRIEELVREHAEESRDLRADIRSLDSELSAAKATITKLRQRKPPNTNNGVDKLAALEAELGAAKKTIAQLHTNNGVDAAFWKDAYDRAEAELNTYRDPWLEPVRAWLDARPNEHRHHTVAILYHALGVDEAVQIDRAAERRLGEIMRRIGGWAPSENIGGKYNRGRGYIRT